MAKIYKDEIIEIKDIKFPNKGVGEFNGEKVAVKNTVPGQKVRVDIKRKKGKYEGRLINIEEKADYEISSTCPGFGVCGGCTYKNLEYKKELEFKEKVVLDLLKNGGITDFEYVGIRPSPIQKGYRNKMEFSFGDNGLEGELCLGMKKRNSNYEVVNAHKCELISTDIQKILSCVLDYFKDSNEKFYHKMRHTGTLRNLLIRSGYYSGDINVNIVTTSLLETPLEPLKDLLLSLTLKGQITGISHIINDGVADVVRADTVDLLYGSEYVDEKCLGLDFKISTFSFFQTNTPGAEVLYSTVRDFAGKSENKIIYDLYCGTGTITQLLSPNAKKVVGIEIVEEAVEAAKINAKLNNISNCTFLCGDVLKTIDELQEKADTIILDPPREGVHPKAVGKIASFGAQNIVYVSCKASSLTKDLTAFAEYGYKTQKICLVDMFPGTYHVETVVLMSRVRD